MNKKTVGKLVWAVLDALFIMAGIYLAWKLWGVVRTEGRTNIFRYAPIFLAVYMLLLVLTGTYRVDWRYASLGNALRLFCVCLASAVLCLIINRVTRLQCPRLIISFHGFFTLVLLLAMRYVWLLINDKLRTDKGNRLVKRSLIVGCGSEGAQLADTLAKDRNTYGREPVAFLDGDIENIYRRVAGLTVEGTFGDTEKVVSLRRVDEVLFTEASLKLAGAESVCLSAIKTGCRAYVYKNGGFTRLTVEQALDPENTEKAELAGKKIAIIGTAAPALELAARAKECGAECVIAGHDEEALASFDGKACLSAEGLIATEKPDYVFYLDGISDTGRFSSDKDELDKRNRVIPEQLLTECESAGVSAFVCVGGANAGAEIGKTRLIHAELAQMYTGLESLKRISGSKDSETLRLISARGAAMRLLLAAMEGNGEIRIEGSRETDRRLVSDVCAALM